MGMPSTYMRGRITSLPHPPEHFAVPTGVPVGNSTMLSGFASGMFPKPVIPPPCFRTNLLILSPPFSTMTYVYYTVGEQGEDGVLRADLPVNDVLILCVGKPAALVSST